MKRLLAIALLVSACGLSAPTPAPTDEPAGFDVAATRAVWAEDCDRPEPVDEVFCGHVKWDRLTGWRSTLEVPTDLLPSDRDGAKSICLYILAQRFDSNARPLGYDQVGVLDRDGGNAWLCP